MGQYSVQQDSISWMMTTIAAVIFLYLMTVTSETVFMIAMFMLITGILLNMVVTGKIHRDPEISGGEGSIIFSYSVLAVGAIVVSNMIVPFFIPMLTLELSVVDMSLFAVLMAIAEEQFFRGFLTPFFANRVGAILGIVAGGASFAVYHLGVYQTQIGTLAVVFLSGMVLSFIALKTERVSPGMIAHAVVNFIAAGGIF